MRLGEAEGAEPLDLTTSHACHEYREIDSIRDARLSWLSPGEFTEEQISGGDRRPPTCTKALLGTLAGNPSAFVRQLEA